jgi:transposase
VPIDCDCDCITPCPQGRAGVPRLIESGMVSTALVAYVVASKFAWYLPLYRQVQILAGMGVHLDRSTLALWVKRAAWWLRSLYELQLRTIHASPRIFCDETRMPVIDPGRHRTRTCQFWAHATDDRPWGGPAPPAVTYVFADGRGTAKVARNWQASRANGEVSITRKIARWR